MVVSLIVSPLINGAQYNDSLLSGTVGAVGADLGKLAAGSYTPIIGIKENNLGFLPLYVRHDGVNHISNLSLYIQEFGAGTSYAYGGDDSAPNDLANIIALGDASGSSKNNSNGASGGVWVDMDSDADDTNRFNIASRPTEVFTFKTGVGDSLANSIPVKSVAMVFDSGGDTQASAPVDGRVGAAGDTVHGDNALIKSRFYVKSSYLASGNIQWEKVFTYSFTS